MQHTAIASLIGYMHTAAVVTKPTCALWITRQSSHYTRNICIRCLLYYLQVAIERIASSQTLSTDRIGHWWWGWHRYWRRLRCYRRPALGRLRFAAAEQRTEHRECRVWLIPFVRSNSHLGMSFVRCKTNSGRRLSAPDRGKNSIRHI